MKPGEQFCCPHCGENSFLMKEAVMEGWKKTGDVLKCVSCGAVIENVVPETAEQEKSDAQTRKRDALAALFGEEPAEKRFCRDCKFRVMNAFRIRCMKHDKDVNPMDDCEDFVRRNVL